MGCLKVPDFAMSPDIVRKQNPQPLLDNVGPLINRTDQTSFMICGYCSWGAVLFRLSLFLCSFTLMVISGVSFAGCLYMQAWSCTNHCLDNLPVAFVLCLSLRFRQGFNC